MLPGLYTIAAVADAAGMNPRALRHLVDMDRLEYVQWERNAERYLTPAALARLESFGIRIDHARLNAATTADPATPASASSAASSTQDSENES